MNCWVISPNVLNNPYEPVEDFIKLIEKEHIALIGWHENKRLGYNFKNTIELNDLIIIAQGANFQKRNFFAGLVNSEAYKYKYKGNKNNYTLQAINLKNFLDIKDKSISWNNNCAYGEANRIPALYELKSDNPNDKKVIDEVLSYINSGGKMTEYIELLKSNKNLILTGAPGTGKTYLAKNIASQIILNKDYDESVENDINFKEQCAFVQFHPSYDYTDFVEGLRPMQDENGNIGFERKDGVFKAFCKKALKNLKDSEKDIATLNYDEIIKKYFLEFIENDIQPSIAEKGGYGINGLTGEQISPVVYVELKDNDRFNYKINSKQNNQYTNRENLNSLIECYKNIIIKNYDKITHKMLTKYTRGYASSTYGILKAFYDKYNEKIEQEKNNITVQEVEKRDFVFIIDEINRGEISKIFGELFFSVDSGYRGEKGKVQTQYANLIEDGDEFKDGFYIPENVYIIGTMNDIDRSVESMDFAMRRRFAWKEIKAETEYGKNMLNSLIGKNNITDSIVKEVKDRMKKLNEAISNTPELSDAYNIGASYFLKLENYYKDKDKNKAFKKLWENHLEGLLFEYTRGMQNQETILKELKSAYNPNNTDNKSNNQEENKNS